MGKQTSMEDIYGGIIEQIDNSLVELKTMINHSEEIVAVHQQRVDTIEDQIVKTLMARQNIESLFTTSPVPTQISEKDGFFGNVKPVPMPETELIPLRNEVPTPTDQAPAATLKAGRFSDEEVGAVITGLEAGTPYKQIAKDLNRSPGSVKDKIQSMRRQAKAEQAADSETHSEIKHDYKMLNFTKTEDKKLTDMYLDGLSTKDISLATGKSVKAVQHRIKNLTRTGALTARKDVPEPKAPSTDNSGVEWSLHDDLKLLERLTQGHGMPATSKILGREKAECVARFKTLVANPSMEAQEKALKRVKSQIDNQDSE